MDYLSVPLPLYPPTTQGGFGKLIHRKRLRPRNCGKVRFFRNLNSKFRKALDLRRARLFEAEKRRWKNGAAMAFEYRIGDCGK